MTPLWHWVLAVTGTSTAGTPWANFWGGFGADLGEFAVVGSIFRLVVHAERHCLHCGHHQ